MEQRLLFRAYRKLKSHVYYDGSNLFLRRQVAEFEASGDVDAKLKEIGDQIQHGRSEYWRKLYDAISYYKVAKQLEITDGKPTIITNKPENRIVRVKRVQYFVDAPIERKRPPPTPSGTT